MYGGQQPIFILKEGTERTSGKSAQSNNIAAAKAVADAVRSTLGPKGMDKMLVDSMGDVVITNDGATILKEMDIEHPAAKMESPPAEGLDRWPRRSRNGSTRRSGAVVVTGRSRSNSFRTVIRKSLLQESSSYQWFARISDWVNVAI